MCRCMEVNGGTWRGGQRCTKACMKVCRGMQGCMEG